MAEPDKPGLVDRIKQTVQSWRRRRPSVNHTLAAVEHFGQVQGSVLAGAVTYFGFLSFFPILALAFAVIGYVTAVYPDAEQALVEALNEVLPGLIGDQAGQIPISAFKSAKGTASIIGAAGLLYSGLGWLSGMRAALVAVFEIPPSAKRNFVLGKAVDLLMLLIIGLTLILSVAISGFVSGFAADILGWLGLDQLPGADVVLWALGIALGIGASTVLFFALFRLLTDPPLPAKALWQGALLAGIGFELLKQLASLLIRQASSSPAAAVLGVSLVLLIWINYFSRVTVLGAAWAHTTPTAVERRRREARVGMVPVRSVIRVPAGTAHPAPATSASAAPPSARSPQPPSVDDRRGRTVALAAAAGVAGVAVLGAARALRRPR